MRREPPRLLPDDPGGSRRGRGRRPDRVAPGTYAGGLVIGKSVQLDRSGGRGDVISGGGPVVTIGVAGAASEPTVSISGVTIRDGVNASDPTFVVGGGILIPAGAGGATGATVTIADSVVTGNRATPTVAAPVGPPCPGGPCGFARGDGGGIASWGRLTLRRTTVSGNEAGGPVASDAHGGGIWSAGVATLTLKDSAVTGNDSDVVAPNGRFAIGGGVHIQDGGSLEISNSVVSGNTASLTSSLPGGIDMIANGGGIHVGDGSTVTIDRTRIDGNSVVVDDVAGQPSGFDAGMIVGVSTLVMRNSTRERQPRRRRRGRDRRQRGQRRRDRARRNGHDRERADHRQQHDRDERGRKRGGGRSAAGVRAGGPVADRPHASSAGTRPAHRPRRARPPSRARAS